MPVTGPIRRRHQFCLSLQSCQEGQSLGMVGSEVQYPENVSLGLEPIPLREGVRRTDCEAIGQGASFGRPGTELGHQGFQLWLIESIEWIVSLFPGTGRLTRVLGLKLLDKEFWQYSPGGLAHHHRGPSHGQQQDHCCDGVRGSAPQGGYWGGKYFFTIHAGCHWSGWRGSAVRSMGVGA